MLKSKKFVHTKDIELNENVTFEDLMLSKSVVSGLRSAGFIKPSPIQFKAIPLGKLGLDLIVQAKSGTGKTCVFAVIALENLLGKSGATQVLILAPTREVALQITGVIRLIGSNMKIKCHAFIGGQSVNDDINKLKMCQIAVGTPGRISHLIKEKHLKTDNIRLFVLDEADRLLSHEFQEDINLIFSNLPENKQIIVLSATYPHYMATYVTRYMRSAATYVRLNAIDPSLRGIQQYYKVLSTHKNNNNNKKTIMDNILFDVKIDELVGLLSSIEFTQCIVFTNYQLRAEYLCDKLNERDWPAIFIAGNIDQSKRNKAINQLKQFKCRILVSTDLTARGIDAQNVDLIVCMDVPIDAETYLHRIGRAGRYGTQGTAVSFVAEQVDLDQFENIINSYKLNIRQFESTIDDIVRTHNDEKSDGKTRIDDVTIERVNISAQQLSDSFDQYIRAKDNLLKCRMPPTKPDQQGPRNDDNDDDDKDCCLFNAIDDVVNSLNHYHQTNEFVFSSSKRGATHDQSKNNNRVSVQVERDNLKKTIDKHMKPRPMQEPFEQTSDTAVSDMNKATQGFKGVWRLLTCGGSMTDSAAMCRSSHSVNLVNGKIYVFGGEKEPRVPVKDPFVCFDLSTSKWSIVSNNKASPSPRLGHATCHTQTRIYLFGGRNATQMGNGSFNDLYEFNTDTLVWSLLDDGTSESAPEQRSYHAMTCTDDEHIYVFGGCGATRLADFHRFDKSTAKWTKLAVDKRIEPRGGAALCSYTDKHTGKQLIYCIGGFCGRELDNCFSYNVDDDKWSQVEPGLPIGLSVFASSACDSADHDRVKLVLHGGEIGPSRGGHELAGQFSDATYIYDGDKWSKIEFELDAVLPCARAWHASSFANGHFYIYGGLDQNNVRLCDLYELTVLPATN